MMGITTIKLTTETKRKLEGLKKHPRETFEDVIRRLLPKHEQFPEMLERAISYLRDRGVKFIAVFGSRARGEAQPDSDLDLLVEFPPDTSLLAHVGMEQELSELLGVKVELVSRRGMSPYMRNGIEKEARVLLDEK
jgi:hypothetical protein